jgi:FMN phosphatase YigB (HAD superfamily)
MIKAIIFDCFGVIIGDGLFEAYALLGGNVEADKEFIMRTVDAGSKGTIPSSGPIIAEKLGVSLEVWKNAQKSTYGLNQPLLNYVLELRKNYKTAMLSNIGKNALGDWFKRGFLEQYFEVIVGSGDIGFAKPEPEAYKITLDRIGVEANECIFIDDRQPYIEGGKALGMKTILFTSLEQLKQDLVSLL